jgi:hypothetical protein
MAYKKVIRNHFYMCLVGDTENSVKFTNGLEIDSLNPRNIQSLNVVQYDSYSELILSRVIV